jgi:long-subunit fatty acid transport protein
VAKYDIYDPDQSKEDNASTWYVLGVNYNFNANTRIQASYTIKEEEGTGVDNNYASLQFQIGF